MSNVPYSEVIIDAFVDAMKLIQTSRGYDFDVQNAQRYDHDDLERVTRPCVHVFSAENPHRRSGDSWDIDFTVETQMFIREHELDEMTTEQIEMLAKGNIFKAVTNEIDWGTLRCTLNSMACAPLQIENELDIAVVATFGVNYRTKFKDIDEPIDPDWSPGP